MLHINGTEAKLYNSASDSTCVNDAAKQILPKLSQLMKREMSLEVDDSYP